MTNSSVKKYLTMTLMSGALCLSACESNPTSPKPQMLPPSGAARATAARGDSISTLERTSLESLTKAVAIAFGDGTLRASYLQHQRAGGVSAEYKLSLRSYLAGTGKGMAKGMAQRSGVTSEQLTSLLDNVRPLEMYIPIRAQRKAWAGGDVIVASQLRERDEPVGYTTSGERVQLTNRERPTMPTIALVPIETDFARSPYIQESALTAKTPKPSFVECGDDCGGGGGGGGGGLPGIPAGAPAGLYMTTADLVDVHEPWIKGDPELEVHVIGPDISESVSVGSSRSCANAGQTGYRYYDQNSNTWSGAALLLTSSQMQTLKYLDSIPDHRAFVVNLWEDDDTECVIKADPMKYLYLLGWGVAVGAGSVYGIAHCYSAFTCLVTGLGLWDAILTPLWGFIEGTDDHVGAAFLRSAISNTYGGTGTHVLFTQDNNTQNGGITLQYKPQ
ncbi:MAG: hypothetical protein ABI969_00255 [bacterium]